MPQLMDAVEDVGAAGWVGLLPDGIETVVGEGGHERSLWQAPEDEVAGSVERLRTDLESGFWDEQYGHLRTRPSFEGSLVLVVADV